MGKHNRTQIAVSSLGRVRVRSPCPHTQKFSTTSLEVCFCRDLPQTSPTGGRHRSQASRCRRRRPHCPSRAFPATGSVASSALQFMFHVPPPR